MSIYEMLEVIHTNCKKSNFRIYHSEFSEQLRERRWIVTNEYPIAYMKRDKSEVTAGRIDIVARKDGFNIALELDRYKPRQNSIFKLRALEVIYRRFVICRKTGFIFNVRNNGLKNTRPL